jgi:hypothetical protein
MVIYPRERIEGGILTQLHILGVYILFLFEKHFKLGINLVPECISSLRIKLIFNC